ncbi:hypothetical protein PVAP13_6NG356400 [Panicum virgatum]|uniref:Uncharacterized protein n=1 Tax=Panicum virgatum TaxID=38727 RepID=A0A8T0R6F2_PANVG|nr:hypothetical protein PVAP13_6NG356400 [Panicum virgatum]
MASHLTSSSLPSSPRSNEAAVEQQLENLKTIISSPSATIDTMCHGLRRLTSIYNGIGEMMCTPSNQASLCQTLQKKAVEEVLGRSLILLDLCSAMQESFTDLKMTVQELLMSLKRGDIAAAQQFEMPKWSIISKTFQKLVCEEEQLQALECSIRDLESGAELLFRRLIQCRVSLLNTLSS